MKCPECAQGKPWNCTGWAINDNDEMVPCTGAAVTPIGEKP